MLRRIDPAEVELGMFIHKLEGSWFKHPFWKARFLLEDPERLIDLRDSEVDAVIIDTTKGRDLAQGKPHEALQAKSSGAALPLRRRSPASPPPFDFRSTARTGLSREFGHAQAVARRSEKLVSKVFLNARLGKAVDSSEVEPVIDEIFASVQRNPHAFNGLMRCKRDNQFIYQHALAVSALMISLARQLKLSAAQIQQAGMAGLLLDTGIGHLQLDLDANGGDYREFAEELLQNHTRLGYDCLMMGGGIPEEVALVALQHHERLDGTGYPQGLKGEEISLLSRMAAICDTYDRLITDTRSSRGQDPATAILEMREQYGKFDPALLDAFVDAVGAYPAGSVVRLSSDRLALVIDQDPADHRLPHVRAFYSIPGAKLTRPEDIFLARCYGADSIVGAADPDDFGIADFATLRLRIYAAACKAAG